MAQIELSEEEVATLSKTLKNSLHYTPSNSDFTTYRNVLRSLIQTNSEKAS